MKALSVQPETKRRLKQWLLTEDTRRRMHYRKTMELRHALRQIRFGRNAINLPPLIREVVPQQMLPRMNMAFVMGETVQGAMASKRPRVVVNPRNAGDQESAAKRQAWLAVKDQTMERQARRPIFWKLVDNMVNDGWGIKKTMWQPWWEFPDREPDQEDVVYNREVAKFLEERAPWPIAQRTVDPLTFFPRVGEYGGGDVIESGLRPVASTLSALGLKLNQSGKLISIPRETSFPQWEVPTGTSPTLRIGEFWNEEIMGLIVAGDVFLFENEQGRIPYTWRPGYTTGLYDPSLEGLSAIYPTLTLQPWIDFYFGVMTGWAALSAIWPTYIERDVGGSNPTTEAAAAPIEFGKVVDLPAGTHVRPGVAPAVGNELKEMISFLLGTSDRFTPPILQGLAPGRIAGVAASALREAALGRISSLIDNCAELLAEEDSLCLYLVDKVIGAPVYAEGFEFEEATGKAVAGTRIGISPRDIQGRYTSLRRMDTDSIQDQIARGTHAVFMKQGRVWSGRRSMRFSGVDDVQAERLEQLEEFLLETLGPQYALQEAAKEQPTLAELLNDFLQGNEQAPPAGEGGGEPRNGTGPRNIGGPAPRGGGRPTGSPKQPGGTRAVTQPRGRMTPT